MTTTVLAYIPSPARGVWYLGPFPIRAYALFIIVGIVVALLIGDRRWADRGGERGVIYDIALWAVPFGLAGGRLYHVITDWEKYFGEGGAGVVGALRIWDGGLGIWGAVALGGVGAWIACRRRGIPLPAFGDAIAPGIILAQAIGRLGNYFNQELYGRPTTVPWGLEIYERRSSNGVVSPDLANGVSTGQLDSIVHPTFLYELLWNLLVFAVLIWVDRRFKIGHGRLFALYVAGYCLGRFWVELLRSDHATLIADIRVNSFTSTFVFIGAVVYIMVAPKGREDPTTLRGFADETDVDELVKELSAVGATSGVVAAAKVAGADEDEDAKSAAEGEQPPEEPETDRAAEELGADVAGVPAESVAEAEQFAAEGEEPEPEVAAAEDDEEPKSEAAAEAEQLAEDVAEVPDEQMVEAEEFAEAIAEADAAEAGKDEEQREAEPADVTGTAEAAVDDQTEGGDVAEPVGGVGAVEGDEVAEAQDAAAEVHEAAVEGEVEAEELAAEAGAEASDTADADVPESDEAQAESEPDAAEANEVDEPVGGVGAVEGDEVAEAQDAAAEVHEAAVEGEAEAEELAAEADANADDTADADAVESDEAQAESEPQAVDADEASDAADDEPQPADTTVSEPSVATDETGGRLRRWLRGRRS